MAPAPTAARLAPPVKAGAAGVVLEGTPVASTLVGAEGMTGTLLVGTTGAGMTGTELEGATVGVELELSHR
jgi:hypothetical protein